MSSIALEVKDLVKTFSLDGTTINAVDHVSFQVKSGEFVALGTGSRASHSAGMTDAVVRLSDTRPICAAGASSLALRA